MKKSFFFGICAFLLITAISSCSKNNSAPDLTTNIVGVYSGNIGDSLYSGSSYTQASSSVTVTKIDNTHIQVTPQTGYIPFTATLTGTTNGDYIAVNSGTVNGTTYVGGTFNSISIPAGFNGLFNTNTNQFAYSLNANNGNGFTEQFVGTK